MNSPAFYQRVRVGGRRREHAIPSADSFASDAEPSPQGDGAAGEQNLPLRRQFGDSRVVEARNERCAHADRLATIKQVLSSSVERLNLACTQIADFQDSILKTLEVIRASRQLIGKSDLMIERARTLGCK